MCGRRRLVQNERNLTTPARDNPKLPIKRPSWQIIVVDFDPTNRGLSLGVNFNKKRRLLEVNKVASTEATQVQVWQVQYRQRV